MADDREVLKEIWNGKVPVCFQLSLDEVVSSTPPENLYVSSVLATSTKVQTNNKS